MSAFDSFAGENMDSRRISENAWIDLENYPIAGYHGQVRFHAAVIENRSLNIVGYGESILNRPHFFKREVFSPGASAVFSVDVLGPLLHSSTVWDVEIVQKDEVGPGVAGST